MKHMSDKQLQLHIRAVILLLLSMTAIAMMGEVYQQNWDSKVTAYPTKTEAAIHDYAVQLMGKMTTEEKVAQMFFGMETADSERAAELGLGGLLLSAQNLEGLDSNGVCAVIDSFQGASEIPLLIGGEEEGGAVNTVSRYDLLRSVPFLSPAELMTTGGMSLVESDAREKAAFLRRLGIHVNFAPVCDVATESTAYLYGRALGKDADDTARYAEAVVRIMNDEGIIGVAKHFPGQGNLSASVATDDRPIEVFETADFLPFERCIKAGAKMVMMSHSTVTAIDPASPVSLSREAYRMLRRDFGYDGVIVTGDLSAAGLDAYGTPEELAVAAVQAGCDLLLTPDFETQIPAVVQAVKNGEIAKERIDESVLRIMKLKIQFGILS